MIWQTGPGSYGRNDADDCAMDCAVLAKAVGKPVRLQYTREQGTGWDPKGPASIHRARAAIDANGKVDRLRIPQQGILARRRQHVNGNKPVDTLAGQTRGIELKSGDGFGVPAESYEFANKRMAWETIPPLLDRASPLRSAHLRDPVGPQIHFASESFMDEVAAALRVDPIEFRLRHVKDPRDVAVIKAAAQKFGWDTRPSPRPDQTGNKVSGRGHRLRAAQRHPRGGDRRGRYRPLDRHASAPSGSLCAPRLRPDHQPGWPREVHRGQHRPGHQPHAVGRGEVRRQGGDQSIDWMTYPILDITETPEKIEFVLIDHPNLPPTGAGEPSMRPVTAAIANAIFDATGVRIRRVPFSPDRVKQALS